MVYVVRSIQELNILRWNLKPKAWKKNKKEERI